MVIKVIDIVRVILISVIIYMVDFKFSYIPVIIIFIFIIDFLPGIFFTIHCVFFTIHCVFIDGDDDDNGMVFNLDYLVLLIVSTCCYNDTFDSNLFDCLYFFISYLLSETTL